MAKDSNNTKLWIGTGLRLGEIKDVLNEDTADLGSLCKSSNINAWARYKPFRNSSKGFEPTSAGASAWASAMTDAGFGFGSAHNNLTFGWNQDSQEWAAFYHNNGKPRGVGGGYNEPYRQLDFADLNSKGSGTGVTTNGYDETIPPPLKINLPSELEQGGSVITVQKDGNVSGWNLERGISLNEVLPASLTNYNLAVLFRNGSYGNILVMGYTPATLGTNGASTVMINGLSTAEGITLPMFDENSAYDHKAIDGDTIKTTVALIPGRNITTGNYEILYVGGSSDTSHQSYNGDLLSLNMLGGMDSADLTYYIANSIEGATGSIIIPSAPTVTGTVNGFTYARLDNISVQFDKTNAIRWGTRTEVHCQFKIGVSSGAAWYFDSNPTNPPTDADPADMQQPYFSGSQPIYNSSNDSTINYFVDVPTGGTTVYTATNVMTYNNGNLGQKIRRPYIMISGQTGSTYTVTVSGFMYTGADANPSRIINFTPATFNVTIQ